MIANGEFNIQSGVTLRQGSEVTVNMLTGYETGSTIEMTAKDATTGSGITMSDDGYLTVKVSNASGVHSYDVVVKDASGNVVDSYVAKFMSINFSGPDAVNATGILTVGDNQELSFNGKNGKQITQYEAIRNDITSIALTSSNEEYVTINSYKTVATMQNTGNINVNLNVLKAFESDTKIYVKAAITLSDGSVHYINLGKLTAKNIK